MSDDDRGGRARLVPSFLRSRFRVKFTVALLVVLFLIGVTGFVGYASIKDTVRTDTTNRVQETSGLQADALSEWVESMRIQTRSVSSGETLRTVDGDESRYLVERRSRLSQDVIGVHLVNTSTGTVTASTDPIEGFQLKKLGVPWNELAVSGNTSETADRVWVSDSAYESPLQPYDEKYVTAFASAVPNADDRYVVVVTRIQSHLETVKGTRTASVTKIVNAEGDRVLYPSTSVRSTIRGSTLDRVRREGGNAFERAGGVAYAYAKVDGTDWVAVTAIDANEAFAVSEAVGTQVLAIVLIALLSLSIAGAVLARQTVGPLVELRDRVADIEAGNLDVTLRSNRTDEIGQLYDGVDSMRTSLKARMEEVRKAHDAAEAERERVATMNRHLEEKATEYRSVMQTCAAGDLTRRMDPESDNDAMTDIAQSFNEMMGRMDRTVDHLRTFADEVAAASEEVTASSEEVRSASQQVAGSIQEISDGAERQDEQFRSVSEEMDELSSAVQQIATASDEVADLAAGTAETGQDGREAAEAAIDGMESVETRVEVAVEAIEALQAEMTQIDELSEFIADISSQTNMLALNANIEASRNGAGDGQGFAVVASEVKDLAAETKDAAEEIDDRLDRISDQTVQAAEEVRKTSDRIAAHAEAVERAAVALDDIAEYADQTNHGVQQISEATRQQSASTDEIVTMVDRAASISAETTAEAETVAAAAEEQATSLSEVSSSASSLSQTASHLRNALDRIETSEGPTGDGDPFDVLASIEGGATGADAEPDAGEESSDARTQTRTDTSPDERSTDDPPEATRGQGAAPFEFPHSGDE